MKMSTQFTKILLLVCSLLSSPCVVFCLIYCYVLQVGKRRRHYDPDYLCLSSPELPTFSSAPYSYSSYNTTIPPLKPCLKRPVNLSIADKIYQNRKLAGTPSAFQPFSTISEDLQWDPYTQYRPHYRPHYQPHSPIFTIQSQPANVQSDSLSSEDFYYYQVALCSCSVRALVIHHPGRMSTSSPETRWCQTSPSFTPLASIPEPASSPSLTPSGRQTPRQS